MAQNVPVQLGIWEGLFSEPIKMLSLYFLIFLLFLLSEETAALKQERTVLAGMDQPMIMCSGKQPMSCSKWWANQQGAAWILPSDRQQTKGRSWENEGGGREKLQPKQ